MFCVLFCFFFRLQTCEALLSLSQTGRNALEPNQREVTEKLLELCIEETRSDVSISQGMSRPMADLRK